MKMCSECLEKHGPVPLEDDLLSLLSSDRLGDIVWPSRVDLSFPQTLLLIGGMLGHAVAVDATDGISRAAVVVVYLFALSCLGLYVLTGYLEWRSERLHGYTPLLFRSRPLGIAHGQFALLILMSACSAWPFERASTLFTSASWIFFFLFLYLAIRVVRPLERDAELLRWTIAAHLPPGVEPSF